MRVERGPTGDEVFQRWTATTVRLLAALTASDPSSRVQWVAGDLSVRTLATTRLAETWIHTGDIAAGLGVTFAPTPIVCSSSCAPTPDRSTRVAGTHQLMAATAPAGR